MKCPRCGEETGDGRTCRKCGEELPSRKDMEVKYKEFKITEVLDIRMPKSHGEEKADEQDTPPPEKMAEAGSASRKGPDREGGKKKPVLIMVAVAAVILAVIAVLYLFSLIGVF